MSSIEEYADKERELLEELHNADNESFKTKRDIVKRIVEVTRKLFDLGYIEGLKKQDISSYVNGRLEEYSITYPRNQNWWSLFKEDEKQNYTTGTNIEYTNSINHQHEFKDGKCQCGCIIVNHIVYEEEQVDDEPVKITGPEGSSDISSTETATSKAQAKAKPKPVNTEMSEFLKRVYENAQELSILARDIENKYQTNPDMQKVLDKAFKDLPKLIEEQKSCQALLLHAAKNADFRHKIGEFEKIKAIALERSTYNTSKVAKLLGVTPKHMTNNIIPTEDDYLRNLNWFKTIFITMPKDYKKGDIYKLNLASWYGLQVERMNIGLHQSELKLL